MKLNEMLIEFRCFRKCARNRWSQSTASISIHLTLSVCSNLLHACQSGMGIMEKLNVTMFVSGEKRSLWRSLNFECSRGYALLEIAIAHAQWDDQIRRPEIFCDFEFELLDMNVNNTAFVRMLKHRMLWANSSIQVSVFAHATNLQFGCIDMQLGILRILHSIHISGKFDTTNNNNSIGIFDFSIEQFFFWCSREELFAVLDGPLENSTGIENISLAKCVVHSKGCGLVNGRPWRSE